ncbi:MAG: diadenylate cyclase CdaA [Oscillospiraceae bacterium]|jgi:diadenylate cyclase|nr:diadenylate cyclase CdaA [Oscillospiraceae bacterium]
MEAARELAQLVWNNVKLVSVWDVLDIAVVAYMIYRILRVVRRTSAGSVINGIILLIAVAWLAGPGFLDLNVISYIIGQAMKMGIIILIVLFQPELRKFLEQVGSSNLNRLMKRRVNTELARACIEATVAACSDMSGTRTGALIVFERSIGLTDYVVTGTRVDSLPTPELLCSIFFPKTPLHDGAVIVRDGRVAAAGCMLPMSQNTGIGRELGMRHRASLGISERSDAVAVVVSEETGGISVAVDGKLRRELPAPVLEKMLEEELTQPEQGGQKRRKKKRVRT